MKCVILAGGMGTRLAEETDVRPKPMIAIGDHPILWHIMKHYTHHGVNDFIICLGYKGYLIKEYFANYQLHSADVTIDLVDNKIEYHHRRNEPWRITLVDTGDQTMTGGRLKRVRSYLDMDAPFCMTYGDGLSDIDVTAEIAFHRSHGLRATVTCVHPPARFGNIVLSGTTVTAFAEKPQTEGGLINGGFSCSIRPYSISSQAKRQYGNASRWSCWPQRSSLRHGSMMVSGSRWTRCAINSN